MPFPRLPNPLSPLSSQNWITVFAFYGPSGTGKSYRAKFVAKKFKTKALIDDGLLILGNKILAGYSAKLEKNYMGAVRVALFDDKAHRDSVAKAIRTHKIKRLLIIGTSEKMILKITARLQLPEPVRFVRIEEIATEEEMAEARRSRQIEGKHIIPVHSHEIKRKTYSKIFVNSIRVVLTKRRWLSQFLRFLPKEKGVSGNGEFEKSIVRPAFSVQKRKAISHARLASLTSRFMTETKSGIRIKKLGIKNGQSGYTLSITADVPSGTELSEMLQKTRTFLIQNIERESGVFIEELLFVVDKLIR